MNWVVASAVGGIAFAAGAVPIHRRFGIGALMGAAAIAAGLAFAGGAIIIARNPPREGEGFAAFVLGAAVLGAVAGGVAAVERIVRVSTIPDPWVERAVAAIGFIGGAMLGAGAGVMLAAMSGPRIA